MEEEAEFMTVAEAAQQLGQKKDTVRRAIARGKLTATRLYGRVLIKPEDLELYRQTKLPRGRQFGWRKQKPAAGGAEGASQ